MNTFVGLVCGALTGKVYAVINPDEDEELDNPRWLLIKIEQGQREPILLVKIELETYMSYTHPDQIQVFANRRLGFNDADNISS